MTNEQTDHDHEDARVEAFLAPLAKVSPATRSTRAAPAPPKLRRVALVALGVVALGAGVAMAATSANDAKQVEVTELNGETHEGVLCEAPVGPNGDTPEHLSTGGAPIQPGDPCPTGAPSTSRGQPQSDQPIRSP
jgi:hypothetical protein